ncbi:MAG: cell division protein FtsL [Muribaculaceae bacterium]|nr:cell division protein FtsL [Muribaculaceae bacterium]
MDIVESLMENHPDSALAIINSIDVSEMTRDSQKAQYALLKSMALDKNYVDTTTFDVLKPAIDYYLEYGTPDEKLRTYYYQGRIYQNRSDYDNALKSYIRGLDLTESCRDSLTIARMLVAQGIIYQSFYDYYGYIDNCLKAAKIYEAKLLEYLEFDCLASALNGFNILKDKDRADSVINILTHFKELDNTQRLLLHNLHLTYIYQFGSKKDILNLIDNNEDSLDYDVNGILNLAKAYNKLGDNFRALQNLNYLDEIKAEYDTFKYLSIKYPILEDMKNYEEALNVYKDFVDRLEIINSAKFEQKSQSMEERHQMELQAERNAQENFRIVCCLIGGLAILVLIVIVLALIARSNKTKKVLAMQKARTIELENDNLKSERERLTLENMNLQLERDKKALEAENLAHRVEVLEGESESLKALLETPEEIPEEVQQAIQTRIEMLNSLLAGYITDNSKYEEPYDIWVKQLTDNTEEFMNSNRLAFQASHPKFIRYFEDHDLTESEINYVCLYAIGLRGKEVGNYMKKRSHVNISSAIRKKLGIDKHETNIGIYVRKLLKNL